MIRNKKYNYFYKITNTKSGEYYFGVHSTDDLDDGYLGSGTRIKEAIEKEGKENFNKEIIKFFSTITEALEEEARVVTKDLVDDPMCYNMVLGGGGYDNNSLTVIDKELGIKVVISPEEYQENKDKYESLIKGKNNGMYGKMWITNGKDNTIIDKNSNIPEGWRKGKVTKITNKVINHNRKTQEDKKIKVLISDASGNISDYTLSPAFFREGNLIEVTLIQDLFKKYNSWKKVSKELNLCTDTIRKIRDFYISLGFEFKSDTIVKRPGRKGLKTKGFSGKRFVNKNNKVLVINETELEKYLSSGWEEGKVSSRLNKDEIMEEYLSGICIRKLAKIHNTSTNIINKVLDLSDDSKLIWFYNDSKRQNIHIKINEENINKVLKNGWKLGRKKY